MFSEVPLASRRSRSRSGGHHAVQSVRSGRRSFERQKGFDFWLEGRRLGGFRRNPTNVNYIPIPGDPYFKPGFPPIGNKTYYPLPLPETDNNPNF